MSKTTQNTTTTGSKSKHLMDKLIAKLMKHRQKKQTRYINELDRRVQELEDRVQELEDHDQEVEDRAQEVEDRAQEVEYRAQELENRVQEVEEVHKKLFKQVKDLQTKYTVSQ